MPEAATRSHSHLLAWYTPLPSPSAPDDDAFLLPERLHMAVTCSHTHLLS